MSGLNGLCTVLVETGELRLQLLAYDCVRVVALSVLSALQFGAKLKMCEKAEGK